MSAFFSGVLIGLLVSFAVAASWDLPVESVRRAEQACASANSTVKSLDRELVTCENRAVIPYLELP